MNEKDFNRAVVAELAKVANDYFAALDIPEGTYTAAELANGKKGKDKIKMSAPDEVREARQIVSVGAFRCEFPNERVFELLYKFERLAGVGQKEKTRFVRTGEPTNAVCSFVADFGPKGVMWMAGHVRKDSARPALCHACLNPERGELVATDGQILSIAPVAVSDLSGELPAEPLMFNVEMIKNLKGKCRITAKADGLTAVDASGNTYTNSYDVARYVNYLSVIPNVAGELYARISKSDAKKVIAFVKAAKQHAHFINIDIEANGGKMIVSDNDFGLSSSSVEIALVKSPSTDIHVTFVSSELLNIKNWTGGVWFGTSSTRPAIFDAEGATLILLTSYTGESGQAYEYEGTAEIDAFSRLVGAANVSPEQPAATPEKSPHAANLPPVVWHPTRWPFPLPNRSPGLWPSFSPSFWRPKRGGCWSGCNGWPGWRGKAWPNC